MRLVECIAFIIVASYDVILSANASFVEWNKHYPACWETSYMKAASPASQNRKFDKAVVVGDIHGNWNGLIEVLSHAGVINKGSKQCEWKNNGDSILLIQTGDVVDRGRFATECFLCLQHLQNTAEKYGNQVIRLIGNHELMWLGAQYEYRNHETDTVSKINKLTKGIVDDILEKKLVGSFFFDELGGVPVLFTHAGLRKDMKSNILSRSSVVESTSEGKLISNFINERLYLDIAECYKSRGYTDIYSGVIRCGIYLVDVIYSVGSERGGSSIGGVMWTDYHILEEEAKDAIWDFVQVVGHTLERGKIRTTPKLKSTCVDAGMIVGGRAYLVISQEGRFYAHEKQQKTWRMLDLTSDMCK